MGIVEPGEDGAVLPATPAIPGPVPPPSPTPPPTGGIHVATLVVAVLCGVIGLALVLPFVWHAMVDPYVDGPEFSGSDSINTIFAGLHALQAKYRAASAGLHSFKDISSIIALMAGAAALATGVLRAPAAITVAVAALAAVVFGTQSLFYSQPNLVAYVDARAKLACIETVSSGFASVDASIATNAAKLRGPLLSALPSLRTSNASLAVYLAHLNDILESRKDERAAALRKIDVALGADAPPAHDAAISNLTDKRAAATKASAELTAIGGDAAPADITKELQQTVARLDAAIADLEMPTKFYDQLTEARDGYLSQLVASDGVRDKAQHLADSGRRLNELVASAISGLAGYLAEREQTAASVAAAVTAVHGELLRQIVKNEPTTQALQSMIADAVSPTRLAAAGINLEAPPRVGGGAKHRAARQPHGGGAGSSQPIPPSQALDDARHAIDAAQAALAAIEPERMSARQAASVLAPVVAKDKSELDVARNNLAAATDSATESSDDADAVQDEALSAYEAVREKLARVDFPRLTMDLRTCTEPLATPPAAPTGKG
jgi:hypothetical protein